MRKIIALTAAAGLLATLTACSISAPSGQCEPTRSAGEASSLVTAAGSFGADPKADFPTPLVTKNAEVSAVEAGEGDLIYPGQYTAAQISIYEGATGNFLVSTSYDKASAFVLKVGEGDSVIGELVACQTVGSRLASVATGEELIGFGGITAETIDPAATFVVVLDLQSSILGKAYGTPQLPQQGMPSVVTAPDGTPGVTIVGDAPKTLKIAVLQQADGEKVEEGQTIYVHYLRVDWDQPTSFKSTWTDETTGGTPQEVLVSALDATTGAGLHPGMLQAIVGQRVGSQVLTVVPPAFGFPDGSAPSDVTPGSTLVYVIDILGIKSS